MEETVVEPLPLAPSLLALLIPLAALICLVGITFAANALPIIRRSRKAARYAEARALREGADGSAPAARPGNANNPSAATRRDGIPSQAPEGAPASEPAPTPSAAEASAADIIRATIARIGGAGIAWLIVFSAVLILLAVFGARGLMRVHLRDIALASAVTLAAGTLAAMRPALHRLISRVTPPWAGSVVRGARDAAALLAASVIGFICIELPYNETMDLIPAQAALFSMSLIALAMAAVYFLCQRRGGGPAIVSIACCGIGIAQHFVQVFKSAAIMPSDLFSLGTAAAVADRYTYELDAACLTAIALTAAALGLLSLMGGRGATEKNEAARQTTAHGAGAAPVLAAMRGTAPAPEQAAARRGKHATAQDASPTAPSTPRKTRIPARSIARTAANLALAGCLVAGIAVPLSAVKIEEALQFTLDRWMPITSYKLEGFLPGFLTLVQDLAIPKPEGYSDDAAHEDERALATRYDETRGSSPERAAAEQQYAQQKPTIIAIMDESFSDLSLYDGMRTGYTGPQFINSLPDALQRGTLQVSVHGGGTANSEFEFLTGNSLAFIGTGKYPYMLYDLANVGEEALPAQLKREGYATTAIHPQNPGNWNRARVYEQFGFDRFLSYDDFDPATSQILHAGYSDETSFNKILDLLHENDDPQFIFEVTMQNHSGYDAIDVPEDLLVDAVPDEVTDEATRTQLTEYLALVNATDRALEQLIIELRQMDRPVVLLFFGDHQPSMSRALNDALYPNEDLSVHDARIFQASYLMWANYDIAGSAPAVAGEQRETGASTLAAQLLDRIGAPLTDYQKAQLGASQEITALSLIGYRGTDGLWYALDSESPYTGMLKMWQTVQYLHFARKV